MEDELSNYLSSLDRDSCYRVDAVLKQGRLETTERVFFVGENGSELGPFVRKRLSAGLGSAFETVYSTQRSGVRLPHLPRIVECLRQGDELVVVMEYVAGETLADAVTSAKDATDRLALVRRVFPDLCDAVSELHELFDPPVIHRDLKPSNVMVSPGGVTLIDLGIARAYREGAEQDTTHFGTRAYAPPEQFGFGQTGVTSDVYALGMLLFFCLVGRDPTPGDRESDCGSLMEPVAVWVRKNGEWAIIHRCRRCGRLSSNRVAADDNPMKLMSIAMKPAVPSTASSVSVASPRTMRISSFPSMRSETRSVAS